MTASTILAGTGSVGLSMIYWYDNISLCLKCHMVSMKIDSTILVDRFL